METEGTFYRELLDCLADGVHFVDRKRRITFWNKGAERLSGYTAQEVLGKSCADNVLRHVDASGRELCVEGCPLAAVMEDGRMREAQVFMHHKMGHRVQVTVRATPMRRKVGEIVGAVEVFNMVPQEINVLKEIEQLRKEVFTDPLTAVGNRRYAQIRLQECAEDQRAYGVPYAILFVDIDHFKTINDTWGHGVGDRVLCMVASVLADAVRGLDTVCRWGGEGFVVICRNLGVEGLQALAERLRMLVETSWLDHQQKRIFVTASFGGAVSYPGEAPEEVVERADRQLYRSKALGRNRVSVDTASLDSPGIEAGGAPDGAPDRPIPPRSEATSPPNPGAQLTSSKRPLSGGRSPHNSLERAELRAALRFQKVKSSRHAAFNPSMKKKGRKPFKTLHL